MPETAGAGASPAAHEDSHPPRGERGTAAAGHASAHRVLAGPRGPLAVRTYTPAAPAGPGLVWAHGGGFAGGNLTIPESDWVGRQLADRGIFVVAVDYSLAPLPSDWAERIGEPPRTGTHFPVASNEVEHTFRWATESGIAAGPWVIGGASAGGNLAVSATLRLIHSGGPVPALAVLAYPTLHAVQPPQDVALRALLDAHPEADRFGHAAVRRMYENYLGAPIETADVYAVPGTAQAEQLTGFPPTMMITSEVDELRISGEDFARKLHGAGIDIDIVTEPDTVHGHLNRPEEPPARASLERFAARIVATAA